MRTARRLIAYRIAEASGMALAPAARTRGWIEATTRAFARRCLPLLIANEAGWFILNPQGVHATWAGEDDPSSLQVEYEDPEGLRPARSHFGHGILTWNFPYLFRTPPGVNLLVRGPSNWPKDGVTPLEGVVEADWAVGTFTMNWALTRPGLRVTFEAGEPICMIVPHERGALERFEPVIMDIDSDRETAEEYAAWTKGRSRFLAELNMPGSRAHAMGWQRDYFRGQTPTGGHAPEHQLKLRLREFTDESTQQERSAFDGGTPQASRSGEVRKANLEGHHVPDQELRAADEGPRG